MVGTVSPVGGEAHEDHTHIFFESISHAHQLFRKRRTQVRRIFLSAFFELRKGFLPWVSTHPKTLQFKVSNQIK